MLPNSISPGIAPSAVVTVQELFADSIGDVLLELLRAARDTGAGRVDASIIGAGSDRLLRLSDNGYGIGEPAAIFAHRLPALGLLSLAGRDVIVRSWSRAARQGWSAHITAAAWSGKRPIAISPDPIDAGTAITFHMPAIGESALLAALREVAELAGVVATFNGRGI